MVGEWERVEWKGWVIFELFLLLLTIYCKNKQVVCIYEIKVEKLKQQRIVIKKD